MRRLVRAFVITVLAVIVLPGVPAHGESYATSLYRYDLSGASGNTVPNTGQRGAETELTLVGDYQAQALGVHFEGNLSNRQSIGTAKPSSGATIDVSDGRAVGVRAIFAFDPPAGGCSKDSANVVQIGRAGQRESQIKLQLKKSCGNGKVTFVQCRIAGNTSPAKLRPITDAMELQAGAVYEAVCIKHANQGGSESNVTLTVAKQGGPTSSRVFRVDHIDRIVSRARLSVANKYPLPTQRNNTDQFNGLVRAAAFCEGSDVSAVENCLVTGQSSGTDTDGDSAPDDTTSGGGTPPEEPTAGDHQWVQNSTLDHGIEGWEGRFSPDTTVAISHDQQVGHDGAGSIQVLGLNGADREKSGFSDAGGTLSHPVAGTTYTASVWVKPSHIGQVIKLRLRERFPGDVRNEVVRLRASSTDWQRLSATYTMRHDNSEFTFIVFGVRIDAGDSFYADDLSLVSSPAS